MSERKNFTMEYRLASLTIKMQFSNMSQVKHNAYNQN